MAHKVIIISQDQDPSPDGHTLHTSQPSGSSLTGVTYDIRIPIPHDATPKQVAGMVERALNDLVDFT